jgi:hypothetical protein
MALPLPKVIPDTDAGGGIVTALQGMNALSQSNLENRLKQIQLQYAQPMAEANLGYKQAGIPYRNALTQKAQEQARYVAPQAEANIGYKNALTQSVPSLISLRNAQAAHAGEQAKYTGPQAIAEIAYKNALTQGIPSQIALRIAQVAHAQAQSKLTEEQAKELPANAESNRQYQNARSNFLNSGGAGAGAGQKEIMGLINQIKKDNPNFNDMQANQAASAYLNGDTILPDNAPLPKASGLTQSILDQMTKRGTTAAGINQQRFATTVDSMLQEGRKILPSVSKYSGFLGKTKGNIDAVKNSLGADTPEYNDYVYFTRTFIPSAAGEMMRAMGVNASDTQKDMYKKVVNPISWDQNPKSAMENYNRMVDFFKKTVSKTVAKSTNEIRSDLRNDKSAESEGILDLVYNPQTGKLENAK